MRVEEEGEEVGIVLQSKKNNLKKLNTTKKMSKHF